MSRASKTITSLNRLTKIVSPTLDIVEGFGCEPPIYPSIAAVLLYQIWPLVLDLCCLGYARESPIDCAQQNTTSKWGSHVLTHLPFALSVATIRWFLLRRRQFAAVVASSDSGLNFNKYLRLLVMSGLQVVVWTPVSIYLFVRNQTTLPHKPYDSWNSVSGKRLGVSASPRCLSGPAVFSTFPVLFFWKLTRLEWWIYRSIGTLT